MERIRFSNIQEVHAYIQKNGKPSRIERITSGRDRGFWVWT